jgi:hypothetical protein
MRRTSRHGWRGAWFGGITCATVLGLAGLAAADEPSERAIIGHAIELMIARLGVFGNATFGAAVVHPQPSGRYWAVVGEAVSGGLTGHMRRHNYVAAVRLICDDADDAKCWRLEKLALDGRILLNRK